MERAAARVPPARPPDATVAAPGRRNTRQPSRPGGSVRTRRTGPDRAHRRPAASHAGSPLTPVPFVRRLDAIARASELTTRAARRPPIHHPRQAQMFAPDAPRRAPGRPVGRRLPTADHIPPIRICLLAHGILTASNYRPNTAAPHHRRLRSPTTPQRPGRSTSSRDAAPVVVETTTCRGPLESIRQLVRIGSESRVPAQQREPDPT